MDAIHSVVSLLGLASWLPFLADRTATQYYDRLLASSRRPSVSLSVTMCIVALGVGVQG